MIKKSNKVALLLCGGDINLSDLPIITNRSNGMIPVNGKPVIGWILDNLFEKGINEIILVLQFDNYKLYNYVEWAFGKRVTLHFAFVQGSGTILHSLLAGLAWVKPQSGVHVILGDTLLRDSYPEKEDFIFSGAYENPEDWCLVQTDSNNIALEYFDKVNTRIEGVQAVAGVYSFSDTGLLRTILIEQIRGGSKEISQLLREYGKQRPMAVIESREWYDFGHINYFNLAKRKLLQSRYFNSLSIDPVRGTITKKSDKNEKLADELAWYQKVPSHLQLLSPRIVESKDNGAISITQEYYGYPNLAELYVFSDLGVSVWMNALKRLMEIHMLFVAEGGRVDAEDVLDMYTLKTRQRLNELVHHNTKWQAILDERKIKINGKTYRNFCSLETLVNEKAIKMSENVEATIIHGDYCFSNILYDLNSQIVRLIDPRGSFGNQKLYGDPRYDIAKLRHSVSGRYDFILADLFWVKEDEDGYLMQLYKPEAYDSVCRFFDDLISRHSYNKKEIMFIEALLFISMVPLHKDKSQRQLAMYLNGILLLNQVFE